MGPSGCQSTCMGTRGVQESPARIIQDQTRSGGSPANPQTEEK